MSSEPHKGRLKSSYYESSYDEVRPEEFEEFGLVFFPILCLENWVFLQMRLECRHECQHADKKYILPEILLVLQVKLYSQRELCVFSHDLAVFNSCSHLVPNSCNSSLSAADAAAVAVAALHGCSFQLLQLHQLCSNDVIWSGAAFLRSAGPGWVSEYDSPAVWTSSLLLLVEDPGVRRSLTWRRQQDVTDGRRPEPVPPPDLLQRPSCSTGADL